MDREEAIEHLRNMKMPHDKFYEETDETNKTLIDKGNEALDMGIKALENQKTGHCKDCDKWKKGKRENNEDWYSDEGYCSNWRTMTGEKFYCGDFVVKENKE